MNLLSRVANLYSSLNKFWSFKSIERFHYFFNTWWLISSYLLSNCWMKIIWSIHFWWNFNVCYKWLQSHGIFLTVTPFLVWPKIGLKGHSNNTQCATDCGPLKIGLWSVNTSLRVNMGVRVVFRWPKTYTIVHALIFNVCEGSSQAIKHAKILYYQLTMKSMIFDTYSTLQFLDPPLSLWHFTFRNNRLSIIHPIELCKRLERVFLWELRQSFSACAYSMQLHFQINYLGWLKPR